MLKVRNLLQQSSSNTRFNRNASLDFHHLYKNIWNHCLKFCSTTTGSDKHLKANIYHSCLAGCIHGAFPRVYLDNISVWISSKHIRENYLIRISSTNQKWFKTFWGDAYTIHCFYWSHTESSVSKKKGPKRSHATPIYCSSWNCMLQAVFCYSCLSHKVKMSESSFSLMHWRHSLDTCHSDRIYGSS